MKKNRRPAAQQRPSSSISAPSLLVAIEKPVYGGNFLARHEGKAIFVPLALPGESVRARLTQNKSGYATAELDAIVTASPDRIAALCPHFGPCGGCNYQHTSYAHQLAFKQAILGETLERAGVPVVEEIGVLSASPWAYRNRIRVAFDAEGNPGYRARRSHELVRIRACPISEPVLVSAAQAAGEILARVPPNLRPHELLLFCNPDESALLATFFVPGPTLLRIESLAAPLQEVVPALQGVELATGGRPGHPPMTLAEWGAPSLAYPAAGFDYRVDHGAFFQVNRWLIDSFVAHVIGDTEGNVAWDLYAGVGLFARQLTSRFARVVAVESAPASTPALAANLSGTCGVAAAASTLEFLRQNRGGPAPDLIVVDPPRNGLEGEISTLLAGIGTPQLVYVSCDPATLARDLKVLLAAGYTIDKITLADLFPQTFHLETVVRLRKS
ncbi:class I SAM-dependent RNA methyltransferase [Acidobacteria bacterium AB60]|nr:class I SAM-dependent RNA methyltransferase [Acidobacteria bacterium AB60]